MEPWEPAVPDQPLWRFGPAYRDPADPIICCHLAEDDPDHDAQACLDEQAEAAAEAKAEQRREEEMFRDW
jgi:hypothetical protein